MPRISQLASLTTADNSDELPIVDVSASVTKKITRGDLLKAPLPANSVTNSAIADEAVTADKIDFTTSGKIWWEEIGRVNVNGTSGSLSFTPKRFMKIIASGSVSGSGTVFTTINNNQGSVYQRNFLRNAQGNQTIGSMTLNSGTTTSLTQLTGLDTGERWYIEIEAMYHSGVFSGLYRGSGQSATSEVGGMSTVQVPTSFQVAISSGSIVDGILVILGHD